MKRNDSLLSTVGARVRAARERLGLSRRELSERSGVSERFLAQLEGGQGNISLARFAEVAAAVATTPAELLAGVSVERRDSVPVALLGVRGAGKSTVGERLARRLGAAFVEVDQRIEQAAGLALGEIFELHGEAYYRRLEREVLVQLLAADEPLVLATGGSIVNDAVNYGLLRERARTVWLRARAEDHWNRVVAQGDQRPMAQNPHAFAELRALLAAREGLYAAAQHVVDTGDRSIDQVVAAVAAAVGA
ncbi:MAG: helix-turn-helix domain-containing protein [Kofleriaceae bacterium]|nr:helix-turn-helix domain-containing protein [Myxococcales bacterium]MCB9563031.1 helix-turn-helix domain-containing protein [Kofleriaceae bacterium]